MICKECGADNRQGLSFCANCGMKLEQPKAQEGAQKKKLLLLLTSCGAVLLLTVILLTCLLSQKSYERDAKRFVKAVLRNDMQTVQELMAPCVYDYAGGSLDMGKSVESCKVRLGETEPMSSVPLLNYNELLVNLGSERKMTEAYYVTVKYQAESDGQESEDEFQVVMGKIGDKWYVITLESS